MLQSTCAYTLVGVQEKLKNDSRNEGGAMYDTDQTCFRP